MKLHTFIICISLLGCQETEKEHQQHTMYCNQDPSQNLIADDMDCDGYMIEEDCDDNDGSVNPGAEEIWYDGIDQNCDELSDYDQDQDGVIAINDCDDTDSSLLTLSNDDDCDGIPNDQDCEENNPNDMDCDNVPVEEDCDDNDPTLLNRYDDYDCDGIVNAIDCNDYIYSANDMDCDDVLTIDDCNDNDSSVGAIAQDTDCDGTTTDWDCDDNDPNSTTMNYYDDPDCDGVVSNNDCDNSDPNIGDRATDSDCDGVLTIDDCDDNDPSTADDMDCDGVPTSLDCNDSDASFYGLIMDPDCDGDVDGIELSVGSTHNCVLNGNNNVICWGDDSFGQASAPAGSFIEVSSGYSHSCAVDTASSIQCWGDDTFGQVSNLPSTVQRSVSSGGHHSCAIESSGGIQCWGDDTHGQVSSAPTGNFTQVESGYATSCAIDTTGSIQCWGDDTFGQVSNSPSGNFSAVSVGQTHACAIDTSGSIQCWGDDTDGQVSNIPSGTYMDISVQGSPSGSSHSCAIDTNTQPICWGANDHGKATAPTGNYLTIGAGAHHSCAINTAGILSCWGISDGSSEDFEQTHTTNINVSCSTSMDMDCDGSLVGDDCNDNDGYIYPGAAFNESPTACMRDQDQDGYGDSTLALPYGCYEFHLHDSYGDGWNGAELHILNNGTNVDSLTIGGFYSREFFCGFSDGDVVEISFLSGYYDNEISFDILDSTGVLLHSETSPSSGAVFANIFTGFTYELGIDCDDTDPSTVNDMDCDGILTSDDCDDLDASSLPISLDADCDGVTTVEDCDDTDPSTVNDMDCDGILTSDDCDDLNATSTIVATDGDCDGAITADDCDDSDANLGAIVNDLDCDGILGFNDCDDNDSIVGSAGYSIWRDEDSNWDGTIDTTEVWSFLTEEEPLSYEEFINGILLYGEYVNYDSYGNVNMYEEYSHGMLTNGEYWTFNSNNDILTYDDDSDGDGIIDYSRVLTYDQSYNTLSLEEFANGMLTSGEYWTYSGNNDIVTYDTDTNGDGNIDVEQVYTYTSNFQPLSWDTYIQSTLSNYALWTYDSAGLLVYYEHGSPQSPLTTRTYTYDTNSVLVSSFETRSNSSTIETLYDASGNPETVDHYSSTGTWIETTNYTYDTYGNLASRQTVDPGGVMYSSSWTYDANGTLLSRYSNSYGDVTSYTWAYDANGNETYYRFYESGMQYGTVEISRTFDANDNVLTVEYYSINDDNDEYTADATYTYNSDNQLLTFAEYSTYEPGYWGSFSNQWEYETYTYDANGHLSHILLERDDDADGSIDTTNDYFYTFDVDGNPISYERDRGSDGIDFGWYYTLDHISNGYCN